MQQVSECHTEKTIQRWGRQYFVNADLENKIKAMPKIIRKSWGHQKEFAIEDLKV